MSEVKLLGMYIMENLSWRAHIPSLCHSLSKTYYMIKSLQNTLSTHMLWYIYYAHFQSWLRYGIILCGGTKESIKLLHIQKKVIRPITGLKRSESCRQTFIENRILMVTSLHVWGRVFHKEVNITYILNFVIHLCFKRV
jgi:hypothetical protein